MRQRSCPWLVLLLLAPVPLAAQSALTGVVREDSSAKAVPGVEIVITAANKKATTDTAGRFVLGGLAHGAHVVLVRAIGYRPILLRVYLITNDTLVVDLNVYRSPVELAPLEVTATAIPLGLDGFEERRLQGFGQFIDWTQLRKVEHQRVSDVFRGVPGVRIRFDEHGEPFLESAREHCPMQIYFDGIQIYRTRPRTEGRVPGAEPPLIDRWHVTDFDAIEIYRGASETPMMYGGTTGNCGTVVLWTRRH